MDQALWERSFIQLDPEAALCSVYPEEILHRQEKATLLFPKGISTVLSQQTANEGLVRDITQYKPLTGPQIITSLLSLQSAGSGYEPVT